MPRKTKNETVKTQKIATQKSGFSFSILDAILLIIFIVVVVFVGARVSDKGTQGEVAGEETEETVSLESVKYQGEEGVSVYDLLARSHKVDSDKTEFGVFVNGIDDVENSSEKYWIYYVNGQIGDVAADKYATKEGDEIEWRYQSLE